MNRTIGRFVNESLRKLKAHKERIKKFRFSNWKEDFVITEQEEREGGFFGDTMFSKNIQLKIN
jgi:hypothetical protein